VLRAAGAARARRDGSTDFFPIFGRYFP